MQNKNIFIIGKNKKIKDILLDTGYFKDVIILENISSRLLIKADVLIASDNAISYSQFIQNYNLYFKKIKSIFYIIGDPKTYTTIQKKLSSYGIIVLPPQLTEKQICGKICSAIIERFPAENSIACFMGAGHGVGVDMISQSISRELSDMAGKNIIFLILNGKEGISYLNSEEHNQGLGDLKEKLKNNILTIEELKDTCINKERLYILPGEKDISRTRFYHPEEIEKLIQISTQGFDIVFVNCGSDITGMNIGALNSASHKYLITTQSEKHFKNFKRLEEQILSNLGISTGEFYLILNKFIDSEGLLNEIDISKNYGMYLAGVIPLLDYEVGLNAEMNRKLLLEYSKPYRDCIKNITYSIAQDLKIETCQRDNNHNVFKKLSNKFLGRH